MNGIDPELTESEQHRLQNRLYTNDSTSSKTDDDSIDFDRMNSLGLSWLDQLTNLGFLGMKESVEVDQLSWLGSGQYISDFVGSCRKTDQILYFIRGCL